MRKTLYIFIFVASFCKANTYTISVIGGNFSSTSAWTTSVVPTSTDNIVCLPAGASGNLTIDNTGTPSCASIDFTNYTNTVTWNNTLLVAGNVTLVSAMTITTSAGTPVLNINTTATLTSNTKAFPYQLGFNPGNATTYTFADNWTVGSVVQAVGGSGILTLNGNTLTINGNITTPYTGEVMKGTTALVFNGTMSVTANISYGNSINISATGNVTFGATFTYQGTSFTCNTSATVNASSSTLVVESTATYDLNPITWQNIKHSANATITLSSNLNAGQFQMIGYNGVYNGNSVNLTNGIVLISGSGSTISGTANFIVTGGTVAGTTGYSWATNLTLTTCTVTGTFQYLTKTLAYGSGTVVTTGSKLSVTSTCTLNTNGITWNNVTLFNNTVLSSNLTVNGTLLLVNNVTFSGSGVFTANTLSCTTAGLTIVLVAAQNYVITNSLVLTGSAGNDIIFKSTTTTKAQLTLNSGATQSVSYVNAQYIDSSLGLGIHNKNGILSNTINWDLGGTSNFFLTF